MAEKQQTKGPWVHRFLVRLLTVALAVLVFWLLGFVIDDIGTWPGPIYGDVEHRLLDPDDIEGEKGTFYFFPEPKIVNGLNTDPPASFLARRCMMISMCNAAVRSLAIRSASRPRNQRSNSI